MDTAGEKRSYNEMSDPLRLEHENRNHSNHRHDAEDSPPLAPKEQYQTDEGAGRTSNKVLPDDGIPGSGDGISDEERQLENCLRKDQEVDTDNPRDPLELYNWDDLLERYQRAMAEKDETEFKIYDEFQQLIKFFGNWVQTSAYHENDRSNKR
ncbi:MAG: hypothetical protein M1837_007340 [Sclerophora amabilis]|nr:MAG: hypothetical protein M1837_007340 [Sclerophora amabilis]